jgi:hypothetical protein
MSEPTRDGRRLDAGTIVGTVFAGAALGLVVSGLIGLAMLMLASTLIMGESDNPMRIFDWWANWVIQVDWLRSLVPLDNMGDGGWIFLFIWAKAGLLFIVAAKPVGMLVSAKYALPAGTNTFFGRLLAWGVTALIFINPPGWIAVGEFPYYLNLDAITYAGALHILGGAFDVLATYKRSPWA